jgi:hypothetical protein
MVLVLVGGVFLWGTVSGLVTGKNHIMGVRQSRAEAPARYWTVIMFDAALAGALIWYLAFVHQGGLF